MCKDQTDPTPSPSTLDEFEDLIDDQVNGTNTDGESTDDTKSEDTNDTDGKEE